MVDGQLISIKWMDLKQIHHCVIGKIDTTHFHFLLFFFSILFPFLWLSSSSSFFPPISLNTYFTVCVCMCLYACVCTLSHVWFFVNPWAVACQAPLSMGFSRQEYWNRLLFPPPGDLPNPGIKPRSLVSPAWTGVFFTSWSTREALLFY